MCLCLFQFWQMLIWKNHGMLNYPSNFAAIDSYGIDSRCMLMLQLVNLETIRSNSLT